MREIIFYTTHCPKCNVLKKKMEDLKIPYILNEDVQEMMELGIQNAPTLKIGEDLYDFSAAIKWLREYEKETNIEWLKEYKARNEN